LSLLHLWDESARRGLTQIVRQWKLTTFSVIVLALSVGWATATIDIARGIIWNRVHVPDPGSVVVLRWGTTAPVVSRRLVDANYEYPIERPTNAPASGFSFSYQFFDESRRRAASTVELFAFAPIGKTWYGTGRLARSRGGPLNYRRG
jgi:hypothetical protein